jgi:hypothetical protein
MCVTRKKTTTISCALNDSLAIFMCIDAPGRAIDWQRGDWRFVWRHYFDRAQMISKATFVAFWTKFGRMVQALRYKRHIGAMWIAGLLSWLLSEKTLRDALVGHPVGTAVVSLSNDVHGRW